MQYQIAQGVQVSLDGNTWYSLSDHSRQPIDITYTLVEQADRMANGTMRKYVVARKFVIKVSWKDLPTLDAALVDYNGPGTSYGGAWIKQFYENNNFQPMYVRLNFSQQEPVNQPQNTIPSGLYQDSKTIGQAGSARVYNAFMTSFTYNVTKRMPPSTGWGGQGFDFVDLDIEFTEV
jgi:hypothetical protein